ncbi:MAG: hypothetical protein KAV87_43895, partial [Desulfobacteraceae bacterium]|nr:hypothetical protein [Desulfobacteraceae bacterium]
PLKGREAYFRGATLLGRLSKQKLLTVSIRYGGYRFFLTSIPWGLITLPLRQSLLICLFGNFRFAAPKSIQRLRWHRLAPYPTRWASL